MKHTLKICLIILSSGVSLQTGCERSELDGNPPLCIQKIIEEIKKEEVRNPPARVEEWIDDGKSYFYITSDCCDQYNILYDENCQMICAPDGGFTGKGDGQCPNFGDNIKKTLIWQDNRSK